MLIDKRIGKDEEYPETTIRGKTFQLPAGTVVLGHGYCRQCLMNLVIILMKLMNLLP
jgi:hypothetical protein